MNYPSHYEDIFSRFQDLKQVKRDEWVAKCPSHEDDTASLAVKIGKNGALLCTCHAKFGGCDFKSIAEGLGVPREKFFPPAIEKPKQQKKEIDNVYSYTDENGVEIFQVVRFKPKAFFQRRKPREGDPQEKIRGGWVWNLENTRRVLYRLPKLIQNRKSEKPKAVFVVEGEKDVETAESLGLIATTNPAGAGKWREEYSQTLKGCFVVIVADNDDSGRQHTKLVVESLKKHECDVRVICFDELGEKCDLTDWINEGGTVEELRKRVKHATDSLEEPEPPAKEKPKTEVKQTQPKDAVAEMIEIAFAIGDKAKYLSAEDWILVSSKLIEDFAKKVGR